MDTQGNQVSYTDAANWIADAKSAYNGKSTNPSLKALGIEVQGRGIRSRVEEFIMQSWRFNGSNRSDIEHFLHSVKSANKGAIGAKVDGNVGWSQFRPSSNFINALRNFRG